jgi:hypothetical protein
MPRGGIHALWHSSLANPRRTGACGKPRSTSCSVVVGGRRGGRAFKDSHAPQFATKPEQSPTNASNSLRLCERLFEHTGTSLSLNTPNRLLRTPPLRNSLPSVQRTPPWPNQGRCQRPSQRGVRKSTRNNYHQACSTTHAQTEALTAQQSHITAILCNTYKSCGANTIHVAH